MPKFKQFASFQIDVRSRDHNPPHFHLIGADFHALIDMRTLQIIRGRADRKAFAQAVAWAAENTDDLLVEWERLNERD